MRTWHKLPGWSAAFVLSSWWLATVQRLDVWIGVTHALHSALRNVRLRSLCLRWSANDISHRIYVPVTSVSKMSYKRYKLRQDSNAKSSAALDTADESQNVLFYGKALPTKEDRVQQSYDKPTKNTTSDTWCAIYIYLCHATWKDTSSISLHQWKFVFQGFQELSLHLYIPHLTSTYLNNSLHNIFVYLCGWAAKTIVARRPCRQIILSRTKRETCRNMAGIKVKAKQKVMLQFVKIGSFKRYLHRILP